MWITRTFLETHIMRYNYHFGNRHAMLRRFPVSGRASITLAARRTIADVAMNWARR
jgi:hypothetical protein